MAEGDPNSEPRGQSGSPAKAIDSEAALRDAAERSLRYLRSMANRRVGPTPAEVAALDRLDRPLPDSGTAALEVIRELDEVGSPAAMGSASGRYYGFVIGSADPAALAANWLAGAWNQNAAMFAVSPVGARLEKIALGWIRELLGLPAGTEGSFVTGATMANFTGLAAARHDVLAKVGWDVEEQGLVGAPPVTVVVGDEAHVSLLKALSLVGLGRRRVVVVPTDSQGRMRADALPKMSGPTILCLQAGNVNSGAFDPAAEIIPLARDQGAWVHVDGAFGLWAEVAPGRRHLTAGYGSADSWATDGHKWLNVPYDSGVVFVRDPSALRAAMSLGPAAYLTPGPEREPSQYTPEISRRARGVDAWAVVRSQGRNGIAELVERTCRHAERFASGLRDAGYEVLNDVALNQVLVSFGDDDTTTRVIAAVQADGTCWCGGTRWRGRTAMRISVSSGATTSEDVERSLEAIVRIARSLPRPG